MTRRLIETWLPIAALGIESLRERTPMTPFPAPNRLHVWWARRPLVASRAAVLASLLPVDADQNKFLHMLGIPVSYTHLDVYKRQRLQSRIEQDQPGSPMSKVTPLSAAKHASALPQYEMRARRLAGSDIEVEIWQLPAGATPHIRQPTYIAGLRGRNLSLIEHRLLRRLKQSRIDLSNLPAFDALRIACLLYTSRCV